MMIDPAALSESLTVERRRLHQLAELSGREFRTAAYVAEYLHGCHPEAVFTEVGGTGVLGIFGGKTAGGPTLLFRAELDALPIREADDLPYRSETEGIAHKCGHDGHMASLLGVAAWLKHHPLPLGKVALLFQPAEETGQGAARVLEDPRFQALHPDYAFAYHNLPGYPLGRIVVKEGPFTAAVNSLIIRLEGKTAHAAEPENGISPAPAMAEILRWPERFSVVDPHAADFSLVTPVYAHMGTQAYGVAAGAGEVHLTLRCWSEEHYRQLSGRLLDDLDRIGREYRLKVKTSWTDRFFGNTNDAQSVQMIRDAARQCGFSLIERQLPLKWGEDFGAISQTYRGAMFGIGAGEQAPALHHPDYDFPDAIITVGTRIFVGIIEALIYKK